MISVIIPVVNEADGIVQLVGSARTHPQVDEVLVVDDGSIDNTPELARAAGARVITSTFLGKGASLRDGLQAARNKFIVSLDANLAEIQPDLMEQLTRPLFDGTAILTKGKSVNEHATLDVTTARPLLNIFFPELAHVRHPLASCWGGRRSFLQNLTFEMDLGVEIGLVLDVASRGGQVLQVDTELHVKPRSNGDEYLESMAAQVTRTIMSRAVQLNRLRPAYVNRCRDDDHHLTSNLDDLLQRLDGPRRLALLEMDRVLLCGNFLLELAHHTDRGTQLAELLDECDGVDEVPFEKIAQLFSGMRRDILESIAHEMPLMPGARQAVARLRKRGYIVGVISQCFQQAAEIVRRRVLADFSIAHILKFDRGKATGGITLTPAMLHVKGCPLHTCCKSNFLMHLRDRTGLPPECVLAIGNSEADICLLRMAGESVAFRPMGFGVRSAANHVVEGALTDVVNVLDASRVFHIA